MDVHQISVFLENRAGQLAEITRILADNQVDLRAISIAETADYGVIRMIVDQAERATAILHAHGYVFSRKPVVVLEVPDEPGGLAPLLEMLAQEGIDIEYMYSLFTHREGKAYMVLRAADEEGFLRLLKCQGVTPIKAQDIGLC